MNSSLVSYTRLSPNRTSPRDHAIDTITIHCVVGQLSVEAIGGIFAPAERKASSNYGVGTDGRIGLYVNECDRSWCSSSRSNDHRAVTIEVACDLTAPYGVNGRAYAALVELVTDICKRNGIKELKWKGNKSLIGKVDQQNMTVHRWFANTACPGDWLMEHMGEIAARVNENLKEETKMEKRYNTVAECPEWARKTVRLLVEKKILNGNGEGLDLSRDMLRLLVLMDRTGVINK